MAETRQQLTAQMRDALNSLQSPRLFELNETLTFTIADMDFEFTQEELELLQT